MKKLIAIIAVLCGLGIFNACEQAELPMLNENKTFKIDFDRFSVGVENNTLVFDTEEDLKGCIDYLNEIGDENIDEFEKSIGYQSYRSTGKTLDGYDAIMATLVNPDMKNVICGYLTVSDFETETAMAYKLHDGDLCNLENLDLSTLEQVSFSFDDDFFEYARTGVMLKAESDYCIEYIDTDNDYFQMPLINFEVNVLTYALYSRSFFYKYLEIFYQVETNCSNTNVRISANYATRDDCYYNKNNDDEDEPFERSEEFGPEACRSNGLLVSFVRRPYTGTSRLQKYNLEVDYYLLIEGIPYTNPIYKSYYTNNFCRYGI